MNDENRVLIRRGARDLSAEEMERVTGGLRTATFCSINHLGQGRRHLYRRVLVSWRVTLCGDPLFIRPRHYGIS